MKMLELAARWEFICLIVAFALVTMGKLFQTSSFRGLLRASDGSLSAGRIQLLVLTVMTAVQYLLNTMHDPTHLPSIPTALVVALSGSQALYLGAKAWTMLRGSVKKMEDR